MTRSRYTLSHRDASPAAAAFAVLVVAALCWPYTVDDAFIIARYAQNLAAFRGYGLNPGQPSDGVTGPLWLLPEVLACLLSLDPIVVAKLVGAVCAASAAFLATRRLRGRACGRRAARPAVVLLALSPSIATAAVSGLETGAATLGLTWAVLCATRRPKLAPVGLGGTVAALAWLRPELALACSVLLFYALLRERREGALALAIALAGAIVLLGFRWLAFGALVPLSVPAKAGPLGFGLRYAFSAVLLATSGVGVSLVWLAARRGRGDDRALGFMLLAHVCALVLAGGDWMPGYRLLVPVLPSYAVLAAFGITRRFAGKPLLGALLLCAACLVPGADLVTRVPELRAAGRSQRAALGLVAFLRANADSVALVDIGLLGYASGLEIVDLGGLTDPRIAHMRGGHLDKHIDPEYLARRAPDAIVLHAASPPVVADDGALRAFTGYPVERRVAALPYVRARYRVRRVVRYASGYYYLVLLARGAR